METLPLFLKAAGVGLAVAAPVGPMSLLCMRRSLTSGWRPGLATGAGIAVGDALFAAVAALGLASVSAFMLTYQKPLHLAAGLILIWLGLRAFRKPTAVREAERPGGGLASLFGGSVLLTLTNPPTIIMFAAIFAALAPSGGLDPAGAAWTVAGVFSGSMGWWIGLVWAVSLARHAIGQRARGWIDRVSGAVLMLLGGLELRRAL